MIVIEYLIYFDTNSGMCQDLKSFEHLIQSNSHFSILKDKLNYKQSSYDYKAFQHELSGDKHSVFQVRLEATRITDKFRSMLGEFRKTLGAPGKTESIHILWDGIAREWAIKLYPLIHEVENLLRKLLTSLMVTKMGIGWAKNSIPKDVKESVKRKGKQPSDSLNYLYELDFIKLAEFLFNEYSIGEPHELSRKIESLLSISNRQKIRDEIEKYVPKNNWDRFFADELDIESNELKKKWEALYEIRCKVAHNNTFTHVEFQRGISLCDELSQLLKETIGALENISIPPEQVETVALNTISNRDKNTRDLVRAINNYPGQNELASIRRIHNSVKDISLAVSPFNVSGSLAESLKRSSDIIEKTGMSTYINQDKNESLKKLIDATVRATKTGLLSGALLPFYNQQSAIMKFAEASQRHHNSYYSKTLSLGGNTINHSQINSSYEEE